MDKNELAKDVRSIDLKSVGVPGRIEDCYAHFKAGGSDGMLALLRTTDFDDDRCVMLLAMMLLDDTTIDDLAIRCAELRRLPSPQYAEGLIERGLLCVVEYSWIYSGDPDAVEYHYWACSQLVRHRGPAAENLIFDRMLAQTDVRKKRSLIFALGILASATFLRRLATESVELLLSLFEDESQPQELRDSLREVLEEDILRTDSESNYLPPSLRRSIESRLAAF